MFDLSNKTAVVTGGGSGIGKAIALLFARQGATVHVLDFDSNGAEQTIREVKQATEQDTRIPAMLATSSLYSKSLTQLLQRAVCRYSSTMPVLLISERLKQPAKLILNGY